MEPGPTVEPRRLNTSLLRLLKVERALAVADLGGGGGALGASAPPAESMLKKS